MTINRSSLSTANILEDNFDFAIEIVTTRPPVGTYSDTATIPNKLLGYYDPTNEVVELYVTDNTGRRYLRVG